jgi:class 3 adenylate cyclase/tetratricopeptide (TPR) repeat protein
MESNFASYVPRLVLDRLCESSAGAAPYAERWRSAVLFADISESTALAARLAETGASGAEELSRLLNQYFGALLEIVDRHRGHALKFAGDAVLGLWPVGAGELGAAVASATQCGLDLQSSLQRAAGGTWSLRARVGVGAGTVTGLLLGDALQRELLLAGDVLADTCAAESEAEPDQVVLTAAAATAAGDLVRGRTLASGALVALHAVAPAPAPADAARAPSRLAQLDADALAAFVPPIVRARLAAGQAQWLADLRHTTSLFARLPPWTAGDADDAQATFLAVRAAIARCGGTVARLGFDREGPVLKAAFGMPPLAHEDDAARAVRAALDLQQLLRARGFESAIGIATGQTFCGEIGGPHRREYTAVGESVHLAARLMQHADRDILCDAATASAARRSVAFGPPGSLTVKGKSGPIAVYRPMRSDPENRADTPAVGESELVGRVAECGRLAEALDHLADGRGGVVVLAGEAGIGKSRLSSELVRRARARGMRVLAGGGSAFETTSAYHAWRAIAAACLGLPDVPADGDRRAHALERLAAILPSGAAAARLSFAPVLNDLLALGIDETAITSALNAQARADALHGLMLDVLQGIARSEPLVLLLEDAHWMDSASWTLALLAAQQVGPLLVVVATRPPSEGGATEVRRMLGLPGAELVALETLDPAAERRLLAARLGGDAVEDSLARFVHERTAGRPLFIEEVAFALREAGAVVVAEGECRWSPGAAPDRLHLSQTVEGVIHSRLDRLPPAAQLALKVASVIGPSFSIAALEAVHPVAVEGAGLADQLTALEATHFLGHERGDSEQAVFTFRHAITREVAYRSLPYAYRRRIHGAVADWFESIGAGDLTPHYALIAYHCTQAVDRHRPDRALARRAVDALERAAGHAAAHFANRETAAFLEDALALHDAGAVERRRRARWERQLGEAYVGLGRAEEARRHLEASLRLLAQPVPASGVRGALSLAREVAVQAGHRLRSVVSPAVPRTGGEDALEAARAYEQLALVLFLMMEQLPSFVATVRGLNLAETVGPSGELSRSCAMLGISAGALLGRWVAERYFELGFAAARAAGDRHASARLLHARGFFLVGQGIWDEAEAALDAARDAFAALGDARWREMAVLILGNVHQMHRRHADSLVHYADVQGTSDRRGDAQAHAWSAVGAGGALLGLGRPHEALAAYDRMEAWLASNLDRLSDRGSQFSVYAIRAAAHLQLGDSERAWHWAQAAGAISAQGPLLIFYALPGYTYVCEVSLRLWERERRPEYERLARRAVADLQKFARVFRIAVPQARLWRGSLYWLDGRHARALRLWNRAAAAAAALDMADDLALARAERARHTHPERTDGGDGAALGCAVPVGESSAVHREVGLGDDRGGRAAQRPRRHQA